MFDVGAHLQCGSIEPASPPTAIGLPTGEAPALEDGDAQAARSPPLLSKVVDMFAFRTPGLKNEPLDPHLTLASRHVRAAKARAW